MPPATSKRSRDSRSRPPPQPVNNDQTASSTNVDLFTDPMLGASLLFYVDKDVPDKERVEQLIQNHGGSLSPSYSSVTYILVDPHKETGQALFRQYANKRGKLVLDARWVFECVKQSQLLAFKSNWAGFKLTGLEKAAVDGSSSHPQEESSSRRIARPIPTQHQVPLPPAQPQHTPLPPGPNAYVHPYPYPPPHPAASWPEANGIPPQATHIQHVIAPRPPLWHPHPPPSPPFAPLETTEGPSSDYTDYARYRPEHDWPTGTDYYSNQFTAPYDHPENGYLDIDNPTSTAGPSNATAAQSPAAPPDAVPPSQPQRGRKRTRSVANSGPVNPSALVPPKGPPARSPTPPTRVLKSTYGGNLYTADDVEYLKKYIDYCQTQGLVLSLREICERIAVKAPHHTFYSWRRYCNKHQIRLGAYQMELNERTPSPGPLPGEDEPLLDSSGAVATAVNFPQKRNRSPTPPRALTRSTTGKGIAFTREDVNFLMRFLEYRKCKEGDIDMVQFWKDVAERAPHHSRASWMKYWRRHKHELEPDETGGLPAPLPEKKLRYSNDDDIFLARYFATQPQGTSDQIFQAFAKLTEFVAGESGKHVGDEYFLKSGDKIRLFFEKNVVNEDGMNSPKEEAVNKIGHALHELDSTFRAITLENHKLQCLVRDLKFHEDLRVLQRMVICKQREVGGEISRSVSKAIQGARPSALEHNDSIPILQCTPFNGTLSFLPGSHLTAPITKRFVRDGKGGTTFETLPGMEDKSNRKEDYALETCEPGKKTLHYQHVCFAQIGENTSLYTRFAYTFHMIEGPRKAYYDEKNWLQPDKYCAILSVVPKGVNLYYHCTLASYWGCMSYMEQGIN
ncbi:hypothetical protein Clacol_000706 [Clathrus columnatus]|uniref:BRCT domain-containing protein n=1 Tax=Clathrus columnatus TaxID=1419009 RepID=A0AAV4ZZR6_9AGAM|nr:hypothetical protein Clacol_000706 [Clathrus columnatus]